MLKENILLIFSILWTLLASVWQIRKFKVRIIQKIDSSVLIGLLPKYQVVLEIYLSSAIILSCSRKLYIDIPHFMINVIFIKKNC